MPGPAPDQNARRDGRLGRASLHPNAPILAGSVGQWCLKIRVGTYGIDEGGTIKVARRFASDFERPQFNEPGAPGYTTVTTDGSARLAVRYDAKGHVRPWMKCVVVDVYDGCLAPGDTVTVTFGDMSQGSPGIRAQTFAETRHEFRVLVDPTNACLVRRLPSSPVVSVVAGEAAVVVPIVPTRLKVGDHATVFVKGEDRWGNPTAAPPGVHLEWEGDPGIELSEGILVASSAATGRVVATWNETSFPSNPVTAQSPPGPHGRWWAELHAQSGATVGTGTEAEYFAFGRDWARLDVMSHQGNDFQITDRDWARLNEEVRQFHEDGRFVVFPGYEWSANTTAGGDRNVFYLEEDLPIFRSSHWQVDEEERPNSPANPADQMFAAVREHVPASHVCIASHCGGRYADIRTYFDPELESLVEVASCWGVFEWLLWDAFEKGYRVGVMCNSDGHKGRPGAENPGAGQFGIRGGLTCILAPTLSRADVFAALKQRRCYGTTGPRIDLDLTVDGAPMGSNLSARSEVTVTGHVTGTAPVEALELWVGRSRVLTVQPPDFDGCARSPRVRLSWGGARIRGRARRATWDGTIEISGASVLRAETFAFDSPLDGILEENQQRIAFRSRTTGDIDGIDLWLSPATAGCLRLVTPNGVVPVDLATLGIRPVRADLGGLDLHATITRYPEEPRVRTVSFTHRLPLRAQGVDPIWIKAVQTDGHMAWASPVYVG